MALAHLSNRPLQAGEETDAPAPVLWFAPAYHAGYSLSILCLQHPDAPAFTARLTLLLFQGAFRDGPEDIPRSSAGP